ncbi:MAG: hypothetical protein ACRBB3_05565 [Alphaproteobacteria bacterium]
MKYFTGVCLCFVMSNVALADNCKTGDPFPFKSPYSIEKCPADIQHWMDRANICAHFSGEEAYDADRGAEIDAVMVENECGYIGCDARALWAKYEGDIAYTGVISDYEEFVFGGPVSCDEEQELPPEERVGDVYLEGTVPDTSKAEANNNSSPDNNTDVENVVKGIFDNFLK